MRIAIITDTHLSAQKYNKVNKKTGVNKFFERQFASLEWVLNYLKEHNIDTIIHAGDLYDSSKVTVYPIERTKKMFADFNVYAIKGNHDDNNFLHANKLSALNLTDIHAINEPCKKEIDGINFVFTPWGYHVKKEMIEKGKYNVLIMHQHPKEYVHEKEEIFKANYEASKMFDLVITGHYHNIEEFVEGKTRYLNPGSTLSAFGNEENMDPSMWIFDTDTKEYERVKVPGAVKIIAETVEDPNGFLNDIKDENIYRLTISKMPDKDILMKAKKIALDVQLKLQEEEEVMIEKSLENFWEYVHNNKPAYEQEFRKVLNS